MLLDSSADVTLVPASAVKLVRQDAIPERRYELEGFDGTTSNAEVVQLELVFS